MHQDKYVFSQLVAFLDLSKFNRIVTKYDSDKYVKHFTYWNQLLTLMFGQLSNRESLRDLVITLDAYQEKNDHLGLCKNVTRSNSSKANKNRDCRIFKSFAYYMVDQTQKKRKTNIFNLASNVYAFDSTSIDLYLVVFWWTKFRKKKGGIKIHTLYNVETHIPAFFHITTALVHDSKTMNEIPYEIGAYYIFDRGYNCFRNLF